MDAGKMKQEEYHEPQSLMAFWVPFCVICLFVATYGIPGCK